MVVARVCAAAAVASAVAAVAAAAALATRPPGVAFLVSPPPFGGRGFVAAYGGLGLVWAVTGAVLVGLRPRNIIGWLVLAVGVSQAWAVGLTVYGWYGLNDTVPSWAAYLGPALYSPGSLIAPTLLLALYPDGRLPGPKWRWPAAAAAVSILLLAACVPFPTLTPEETHSWVLVPTIPEQLSHILLPTKPLYDTQLLVSAQSQVSVPVFPEWWATWTSTGVLVLKPVLLASMAVIWVGTLVRLARARPPRRQQLAWLVCGVMPILAAPMFPAAQYGNLLVLLSALLVPVAVAVGVLRYRLLGIETVLRRGLVYGMFTAAVVAAYLLVTATAAAALDSRPLPGVVAAAVVAVALAPARDRLQRAADRLVYGQRRDPLQAVTELGKRVALTGELDLLPGALASVAAAVRAPWAAVAGPDGRIVAAVGAEPVNGPASTMLPLWFGGQHVGELRVAPPRAGGAYSNDETRLLAALALQVAVVVRAHDLTQALEAERDRVLAATKTERDRLRGDLHDGLGPSLSGVGLGLQALADTLDADDKLATDDRAASKALLDRIREEVATAFAEVRRIIDGLRPTALDTMGLTGAIRRHAETVSAALPIDVVAGELPALPPEVETSAYRITTEALTNAARHAGARHVQVTLAAPGGALRITVADDGRGVGPGAIAGVGLISMRRRAEALGGRLDIASAAEGTTVTATLPLEEP